MTPETVKNEPRGQSGATGRDRPGTRMANAIRRHPSVVAMCGVFALYLMTRLLFLGRLPVFFDESIFIRWAQLAPRNGNWMISMTDGKPPMFIWLLIPFVSALKNPLVTGRLLSVAAGALSVYGMFLIGKELNDWRLGAWGAFLYVICPFTLWYDRIAITEGFLLTVFIFGLYFALRASRSLNPFWSLAIGGTLGLGLLTKGTTELLFAITPFAFLARTGYVRGSAREGCEGETSGGSAGSSVGVRERWRRLQPLARWIVVIAISFVIAIAIYSLLRLSSMYGLIAARNSIATKGVGELLKHPFDVFFSNVGTIIGTTFIFMTPLLLVGGVAGLIYGALKRWHPAWFLLVWTVAVGVIEALVAKHWMFDAILPRFFLTLVPPLLFGAGYFLVDGMAAARKLDSSRAQVVRILAAVVIFLALAFPLYTDAMVIAKPEEAVLPYWIRIQYLTDWPSGWGIRESADYIAAQSEKGPVVVGTNVKGIGLPTDGIEMYLDANRNVKVIPFSSNTQEFPRELTNAAASYPVYVVFNSFPGYESPPADWPLELISQFPKDGNNNQHLYLFKVKPTAAP